MRRGKLSVETITLRKANKNIYWAWKSIKQRCQNPSYKAYRNYGGRGISVCQEWQSFEPFLKWSLENGYTQGLDIDRIDNNGNYCPENCRWVSRKENINNRRNTAELTIDGIKKPRTEWECLANLPSGILKAWIITHGLAYAEKRLADILNNGYKPKDYGYSHRKPIVHVETGKVFCSVKEAADFFNLAPCTISNAMRDCRATSKGRFRWEEIC